MFIVKLSWGRVIFSCGRRSVVQRVCDLKSSPHKFQFFFLTAPMWNQGSSVDLWSTRRSTNQRQSSRFYSRHLVWKVTRWATRTSWWRLSTVRLHRRQVCQEEHLDLWTDTSTEASPLSFEDEHTESCSDEQQRCRKHTEFPTSSWR